LVGFLGRVFYNNPGTLHCSLLLDNRCAVISRSLLAVKTVNGVVDGMPQK